MHNKESMVAKRLSFWRRMTKNVFSLQIISVYTCIVFIPLALLFILSSFIFKRNALAALERGCEIALEENSVQVYRNIRTAALLERMAKTNQNFLLYMTIPEQYTEEDTITTIKVETDRYASILSTVPLLYSIRFFVENESIPERFPLVFHASRTAVENLRHWEYNYTVDYMGNLNWQFEPAVCITSELSYHWRHVAYFQVTMRMKDFFSFAYQGDRKMVGDYFFRVQESEGMRTLTPLESAGLDAYNEPLTDAELARFEELYRQSPEQGKKLRVRLRRGTVMAMWKTVPEADLVLLHVSDRRILRRTFGLIFCVAVMGLLLSLAGFFFLIRFITSRMLKGVYSIMDGMKEVSAGNFAVRIPVTYRDDIGDAQRAFNSMATLLSEQLVKIKQEQQLITDTEMKALQNQINAHFLYNVLETIHMQAVLQDDTDTAESILALGKMMRYCLRWRVVTVPLSQEIEYINAYIYILNIRNDYTITLRTTIPETYKTLTIPKMLLQPFVENAFVHAIEPSAKDALIHIFAERDKDAPVLWLCVQDFGCGMDEQRLEELMRYLDDDTPEKETQGSIGVKNIQQRLTMFYGAQFRLRIESKKGKGTTVRVPVALNGGVAQ